MIAQILALLAELSLGAGVVCAEAHTLGPDERAAVGASVRERVRQTNRPAVEGMLAHRAYARPCPPPMVELEHALAYARGRLGLGPAWAEGVIAFHARYLDHKVGPRWKGWGWKVAHRGKGHTYYRGEMNK